MAMVWEWIAYHGWFCHRGDVGFCQYEGMGLSSCDGYTIKEGTKNDYFLLLYSKDLNWSMRRFLKSGSENKTTKKSILKLKKCMWGK